MFDSKISAKDMIDEIIDEADIAIPISKKIYLGWLNSTEQLLYSEIIKEQAKTVLSPIPAGNIIKLSDIPAAAGENNICFEDIHTIYADHHQLIKSTLASGSIFPNCWYKVGVNVGYSFFRQPELLEIIYFVRPALKTISQNGDITGNVMLPPEFSDLMKAKLRGEAYKLAGEYTASANWLNDYNSWLENFKAWIETRRQALGI